MSEFVVDASVAVCWFVREAATEKANRLIASSGDLVAPSLMLLEFANTLWKKARRGEIGGDVVDAGLREIRRFVPQIFDDAALAAPALALARELDHPVYDCVYLALARQRNAPLITLDERLTTRLAGTRHQRDAVLLADWEER